MPATGRQYARKLGIRNFSTRMLTNPETNIRLGTQYFKDLLDGVWRRALCAGRLQRR
jgi:soluble lytic murein transglycosylase